MNSLQPVALLRQLIQIPSLTGSEAALAIFCEDFLERHGFVTCRQPVDDSRFNLLAERGGKASLLLYAHLDTVAPAPGWHADPFVLRSEGDQLIGLGSSDMKGGLCAILAAAAASAAPLRIALGVDEEALSAGAWELVNSGWCKGVSAVFVPELTIDSPQEVLGIGRRGHVNYRITTRGPRQHGAIPLQTPSAIAKACQLALTLEQLPLPEHPQYGREALVLRALQAHSQDLTLPEQCHIDVSWLSLPGRSPEQLEQELQPLLQGAELHRQPRSTPVPAAYCLTGSQPLLNWVQNQAQSVLGHSLPTAFGLSVADENVLATLEVPVFSLAPRGARSHQAEEWVSQHSLEQISRLYTTLIENWSDRPYN